MSTDDVDDRPAEGTDSDQAATDDGDEVGEGARERLEQEADRAVESFDQGIVDMLAWLLDTETRARIYVYLRQNPASTSEEIAEGTGLYPSTVREALAELHDEGTVDRDKRRNEGAGNNPYEYTAIAPSDLVGDVVGQVQSELNTVFNLDSHLGTSDADRDADSEPVRITVTEEDDGDDDDDDGSVAVDDASDA